MRLTSICCSLAFGGLLTLQAAPPSASAAQLRAQVRRLTAADIGLPASDCGSAGSPTTVTRCFLPEAEAAAAAGTQKTAATIADLTAAAREGGLL